MIVEVHPDGAIDGSPIGTEQRSADVVLRAGDEQSPEEVASARGRVRSTLVVPRSGPYLMTSAGHVARILVDGVEVANNVDHTFPSSLGQRGVIGTAHLDAG